MGIASRVREAGLILLLSFAAVLLHGYHYGVQDQFQYLPAVRHALDPSLYPHDAEFFLPYTQWMLFYDLVAGSIRLFRIPIDWAFFVWHLASIYLYLLGCWLVARRVFADAAARWAAVAVVAALLILVTGGTLLHLADVYLVPRTLATALLLFALAALLDRKPRAIGWIVLAFLWHPTMTLAGGLHLWFVAGPAAPGAAAAGLLPLVGEPATDAWYQVLEQRQFIFPSRWPWIIWVAVFAPLVCLWWIGRLARQHRMPAVQRLSRTLLLSTATGILLATILSVTPGLEHLAAAEPWRVLHLAYLLTLLLGAGLLGKLVLGRRWRRWVLLLAPLCVASFAGQRMLYSSSPHIEWPGRVANNDWVLAFDWVRQNTPRDALFALDPHYTGSARQDTHSFRALAARSQLVDYRNDRMSAVTWPQLAPAWLEQMRDLENWRRFDREDFQQLRGKYGVGWVVLEQPGVEGLTCPYTNPTVRVCRIE